MVSKFSRALNRVYTGGFTRFQWITLFLLTLTLPSIFLYQGVILYLWGGYASLCLIAPFFQRWSFFLPIVTRGCSSNQEISLTFDDGPSPETTPFLLDLLKKYNAPATFFVIGENARENPDLIERILENGHEIGNHSFSHDVFLMLRSRQRLRREISDCQIVLRELGVKTLVFRPPVGITNPNLLPILSSMGLTCLGFNRRAADFGNRRVARIKDRILKRLKSGDIVLLHDRPPADRNQRDIWLEQVESILIALQGKKLRPVLVSNLIQRQIMERVNG